MNRVLQKNYPFVILVALLVAVMILGGGARDDIQSLAILRPIAVICLGIGAFGLQRAQIRAFSWPFMIVGACVLAVLIYLIPLPPAVWALAPGRDLAVQAATLAGIDQPWRPLSLTPWRTWNAFFSLLVPLAVLVLLVRVEREQRQTLLLVAIGFGVLSGLVGLFQVIGPPTGPLYFYSQTNYGTAVGLFANRNHQAMMLAAVFPMLSIYASTGRRSIEQARLKLWIAVGTAVFVLPLLIVTGSRAGLVLGLIGCVAAVLLYRRPNFELPAKRRVAQINPRYVLLACCLLSVALLAAVTTKSNAVRRLIDGDGIDELRFQIWSPIVALVGRYFPFGSGPGSFVEVYNVSEPLSVLSATYVNHAHNDWLEVLVTNGLVAIAILAAFILYWVRCAWALFRPSRPDRDASFGRLGVVLIFMLGVASVVDYPLRVPSLACLFTIALVWMASGVSLGYSDGSAKPDSGKR